MKTLITIDREEDCVYIQSIDLEIPSSEENEFIVIEEISDMDNYDMDDPRYVVIGQNTYLHKDYYYETTTDTSVFKEIQKKVLVSDMTVLQNEYAKAVRNQEKTHDRVKYLGIQIEKTQKLISKLEKKEGSNGKKGTGKQPGS